MLYIFKVIVDFWSSMFQIFWLGKKSITKGLCIYIKSSTGSTVPVDLDPKWDIKNVKEVVGPKIGLDPQEVKIIFAGKELDDDTVLEDCDLGERSILHAVKSNAQMSKGSKPLNKTLADLSFSEAEEDMTELVEEKSAHFYVFCNNPCKSLKEGKLRVRCSTCKSGAITVDSDPSSWSDVLIPHRISGHCEQNNCPDGAIAWAELYFKCASHTSQGEDDLAVPLYLIRSNSRNVPCLACTDVYDLVLVFPCPEGHVTCVDCFVLYCTSRLSERKFLFDPSYGYTLACPAGCSESIIKEPHHFKLLPSTQYDRYQRFATEEFVLKEGGVLCPQPGCGAGILVDKECTKVVCQHGCGYVFCRNCLQGYHIGDCEFPDSQQLEKDSTYPLDPCRVAQARWDEASRVTIKVVTKPCPKCRTPTERSGGCMHMICTRCSFEWCWICQTTWRRECMADHWFG